MSTDTPSTPVNRQPAAPDPQRPPHRWRRLMAAGLKVALPIALLVGGGGLAVGLMETGPKAARQAPTREAKLVEVTPVRVDRATVTVHAMGTVTADRQVDLRPQVGGRVSWVSDEFMPGGILGAGDPLLKIDPKDFELVVRQKAAALATAESDLKIEQGQQSIAKREYELLGETIKPEDRELVLRQPQLATVQAAVDTAKSTLEQARLDLARTHVTAPFNAIVQSRDVNLGTQVSTTTSLTTLVGTDAYMVEVAVPVDQLKWLRVPQRNGEAGSIVRVFNEAAWGAEAYRSGRITRLASQLESEGRMAQLLVAVDDPLALKDENAGKPVLLIGAYVRTEIEGIEVGPVAIVERNLLRDGNNVWLLASDDTLEIRPVSPLFRGRDTVLIDKGLATGERIVATALAAPVHGMALRATPQAGGTLISRAAPEGTSR
ncbi:efflux RND transporter periplasmic adaptor subunit [Shumkonia mesophila]|uniref:efflux RND transporter periplasmic adaptor subunit n=1 Tax=Shumkonia mesophila TaxID=2838854 RepID=UPI0029346417|nr:efflux RND transporter periplasmic adaptor subunit [Shumkonia mesophila]